MIRCLYLSLCVAQSRDEPGFAWRRSALRNRRVLPVDKGRHPTIVFGVNAKNHTVHVSTLQFFRYEGRPLVNRNWQVNWRTRRFGRNKGVTIIAGVEVTPSVMGDIPDYVLSGAGSTLLLSPRVAILLWLEGIITQSHLDSSSEVVGVITTITDVIIGDRSFTVQVLRDPKREYELVD